MENKLKNPVWFSLEETHKKWQLEFNGVTFYNPEICPFGAFTNPSKTKKALNEYAKLTDNFFLVSENTNPVWDENNFEVTKINGCQMVLKKLEQPKITEEIIELSEEYINEIYDLIWLVMPGYYRKNTYEMGKYFGILKNKKLVAVVGQRMQTNDFIEISGVVTHPDYTRRGLAGQLVSRVCLDIINSNKHPILHTTKGNSAISLYEKLGFELTRDMNWWYFIKNKNRTF